MLYIYYFTKKAKIILKNTLNVYVLVIPKFQNYADAFGLIQGLCLKKWFFSPREGAASHCAPVGASQALSTARFKVQPIIVWLHVSRFSHTKPGNQSSSQSQNASSSSGYRQSPAQATTPRQPIQPPPPPTSSGRMKGLSFNFQNLSVSSRTHNSSFSSDTSWAEAPEFVPRSFEGSLKTF